MTTNETETSAKTKPGSALLEEELNTARLRRDVSMATDSLERVSEDLKHIHPGGMPPVPDSEPAVRLHHLLPIVDTLDGAIESGTENACELRQAIRSTLQQLLELLTRHGVQVDVSVGDPYNPERHVIHCLGRDATKLENTILKVVERGYREGNRMIRPAKVIVNVLDETRVGDGS